jgi:hypothetical protein
VAFFCTEEKVDREENLTRDEGKWTNLGDHLPCLLRSRLNGAIQPTDLQKCQSSTIGQRFDFIGLVVLRKMKSEKA